MISFEHFGWAILFLPLLAAAIITLFTRRDGKFSAQLSIAAIVLSFLLSLFLTATLPDHFDLITDWLSVGSLNIKFGLTFDPLSRLMLLIVTGVGGAIHIYSYGYMREEIGRAHVNSSHPSLSRMPSSA